MIWIISNAVLRLAVAGLLVVKLTKYADMLILPERVGVGFMAGASFLTIPVILDTNRHYGTPFDDWASFVFTFGAFVYFCGRMSRHIKHQARNKAAVRMAQAHFAGKEKV